MKMAAQMSEEDQSQFHTCQPIQVSQRDEHRGWRRSARSTTRPRNAGLPELGTGEDEIR